MSTISERVQRGAEWLDTHRDTWFSDINLDELILSSPCDCVLGQLYGGFDDRPDDLEDAEDYGFNVQPHMSGSAEIAAEYDALEAEWRRVITERRAAA